MSEIKLKHAIQVTKNAIQEWRQDKRYHGADVVDAADYLCMILDQIGKAEKPPGATDWEWEYKNLCKFANDFEAQRDILKRALLEVRECGRCINCVEAAEAAIADALELTLTTKPETEEKAE